MSDFWARSILALYRGAGSLIYPFSGPFLRARARKGKEDRSRRGERYGYPSWRRPEGPLVWLHAASVGESLAILPLIERIRGFGINLLFTTGTVTSAAIAEERLPPGTIHQYVPMDVKRAMRRFLDHWHPDLAIFAESEIWPTTIAELANRNVPQILVNARMSDRSNRRWSKRPALSQAIFGQLSQVIAQTELDAERFRNLGAPWVSIGGNLKTDVGVPKVDQAVLSALAGQIGKRPSWVAVSTHKGEETVMGAVHKLVASHQPGLLTIVVPRHPNRADEARAELEASGLSVVTRSSGKPLTPETDIYLGDTIGEMGLYLRLGDIVFMGKSIAAEGGQNPIEPAMVGAAILSGRYVQNFRETYQKLLDARAARLVTDEHMLASHVLHLLRNRDDLEAMKRAARETVESMTGALDRTIRALDAYILPLRVQASLRANGERGKSRHE